MPDFLTESVIINKEIAKLYKKKVFKSLTQPAKELEKIFLSFIDEKGTESLLRRVNSVYEAKYYHTKHRVKNPDNFYEKVIRKSIGLSFSQRFGLQSTNDIALNEENILINLKKIDDIIGLRIVTELKNDCPKVYKLIENHVSYFNDKEITFKDLKGQPQKMQNGLEIYRIKGVYKNEFGFELQIKSKIDEAWGELDHTLFYKDYSVTPIKDTVQVTMTNVGILLDKIEHLLFDLRESGAHFTENADHLVFQQNLEKQLAPILKKRLSSNYRIKEISRYLSFFREKFEKVKRDNLPLTSISFDFLNFLGNTELTRHYVKIRTLNFDLIVIEAVYLCWLQLNDNLVTTQENYDDHIEKFVCHFSEFISKNVNGKLNNSFEYLKNIISFSNSPEIFLSIEKHNEIIEIWDYIDALSIDEEVFNDDEVYDNEESKEEPVSQEDPNQKVRIIKNCFQIFIFGGNLEEYVISIDDKEKTNAVLSSIKESLPNKRNEIDDKVDEITTRIIDTIQKVA